MTVLFERRFLGWDAHTCTYSSCTVYGCNREFVVRVSCHHRLTASSQTTSHSWHFHTSTHILTGLRNISSMVPSKARPVYLLVTRTMKFDPSTHCSPPHGRHEPSQPNAHHAPKTTHARRRQRNRNRMRRRHWRHVHAPFRAGRVSGTKQG